MKKIILAIIAICFLQAFSVSGQVTPGSLIASASQDAQLNTWLGGKSGTLLYRRSRDGANAYTFHNLSDNQGPTVVLFKTAYGTVFGGYNGISWNGNLYNYAGSDGNFLFNLTTGNKANSGSYDPGEATYNAPYYGPTFGGGHDIYMSDDMSYGYIAFGYSYQPFGGYSYYSDQANQALAGPGLQYGQEFGNGFITEVEVYKVIPGTPGGALNFDGANDYVTVPNNNALKFLDNNFSVEYWAKPTLVDGNSHWVISKDNGNSNLDYISGVDGGGKWRFIYKNFAFDLLSTTSVVADTWYHVACTYDGTTARLFINGIEEATATVNAGAVNNSSDVIIGGRSASSPSQLFQGDIDEVRIWNRALPDCEVKSTKDCQLGASQSGLVAYYAFSKGLVNKDNTAYTTLDDATGNNTGTLHNFTLTGLTSNWTNNKITGTCAVYAAPSASIAAPEGTTMCAGGSLQLTANTGSGLSYQWLKDGVNINGATSANYTATGAGAYTVTVTNSFGCAPVTSAATTIMIVTTPTVEAITGITSLCINTNSQLATVTTNGVWSTDNSYVAYVNGSGLVTASNPGSTTIRYSINPPGCGTISATVTVNVYAYPTVAGITGGSKICPSSSLQLVDPTNGGVWSSSNTSVATVSTSGLVSTLASGTAVISYKVTENGCATTVNNNLTVSPVTTTFTTKPTCFGVNNGTATVTAQGGGGGNKVYAISGESNSRFHSIDKATGATTFIGYTGLSDMRALAVSPSGDVFVAGGQDPNLVYKINTETGAATALPHNYNGMCSIFGALAFNSAGELYGWTYCGWFYRIDPVTGQFTQIATPGYGMEGLAFDPTTGVLYGASYNQLFTINTSNGNVSYVGNVNTYGITDIMFDEAGQLFAINGYNTYELLAVDKNNPNSTTVIGSTGTYGITGIGGGGGSYTYLWDNGQTTNTATNLTPGSHSVTVTDVNGCSVNSSVTVAEQPKPTLFTVTGGGAYCQYSNGINVGLSGSENGVNYQLMLNGSPTGGIYNGNGYAIDFGTQYAEGTYTVTASNASIPCTQNMTGNAIVVVNPLPDQTVTYTGANTICPGATLLLSAHTGTGYTYQWRKNGSPINGATGATYAAPETGYYSVIITTPAGCTGNNTPEVYVDAFPVPTITVTGPLTFCDGNTVTLSSDNGGGRYTGYTWSNGSHDNSITVTSGGTYTIKVTNGTCESTSAPVILTSTPNTLSIVGLATPVTCFNTLDGSIALTTSGGTTPYTYGTKYDFAGSSINTSLFKTINGSFTQNNGELTEGNSGSYSWNNVLVAKKVYASPTDIIFESSFRFENSSETKFGLITANLETVNTNDLKIGWQWSYGNLQTFIDGGNQSSYVGNYQGNTWYDFKIEKTGTTLKYYIRATGSSTYNLVNTSTYNSAPGNLQAGVMNYSNYYNGYTTDNWSVTATPQTMGLATGTYTYAVSDAAGCATAATIVVPVSAAPETVKLTATSTPATCENGTDGTVTLIPSSGSGQYSFDIFKYDFSKTNNTIDLSVFDVRNGAFTENGTLRGERINTYPPGNDWDNSIFAKQTIPATGDFVITQSFKFDPAYYNGAYVAFGLSSNVPTNGPYNFNLAFFYQNGGLYAMINGNQYNGTNGNPYITPDTWYDFKIEKKGTTIYFYYKLNSSSSYTLYYTALNYFYPEALASYRFGVLYESNQYYYDGFNSKDWKISNNPPTTNLAPGDYTYIVTDAVGGCQAAVTVNVPVYSGPGALKLTSAVVSKTCENGASGSITLTPSGGTAPYSYGTNYNFLTPVQEQFSISGNVFNQSGGELTGSGANNNSWNNYINSNKTFDGTNDIAFEGSFKFTSGYWGTEAAFGFVQPESNGSMSSPDYIKFGFQISGNNVYTRLGNSQDYTGRYISYNVYYDFKAEKVGNALNYYIRETGSGNNYELIRSTNGNVLSSTLKAGMAYYSYSQNYYGTPTTKNWTVTSPPKTTGLSAGTYTYSITDASGCTAKSIVTIETDSTQFTATATVTHATNIGLCDGSVILTSNSGPVTATAPLFNHTFSGTSLNTTLFETSNGVFSVNGDLRGGHNSSNNYYWNNGIAAKKQINDDGSAITYEATFKFDGNQNVMFGFASGTSVPTDPGQMAIAFYASGSGLQTYGNFSNGNQGFSGSYGAGVWYDFKIEKQGNAVKFYTRVSGSGNYLLVNESQYSGGSTQFRIGAVYYDYSNIGGNIGFNSKNWKLNGAAPTTGLCAGTYTYLVSSEAGCATNVTFIIRDNTTVNLVPKIDPSCGENNGQITLNVTGATPPYTYSIDGGITYGNNKVFSNLAPGTYVVSAMDAGGLSSTLQTVVITTTDNVAPTVYTKGVTLHLDASGNAVLTPSMVDSSSTDHCGIASLTLDKTNFTCADISAVAVCAGNALEFNGNNYVNVNSSVYSSQGSDFTWEAWIKTSSNGTIIAKTTDPNGGWAPGGKSLFIRDGKVGFDVGFYGVLETTTTYNDGTWHHISLTVQKNVSGSQDLCTIYVDGISKASSTNLDVDAYGESGFTTQIGYTNSNFPSPSYFVGAIDEVKIWNVARTAADVANSYKGCATGTEPGMVGYYKFNEGTGSSVANSVTGAPSGSFVNSPQWIVSGADVSASVINNVTLTVTDNSGNVATGHAIITVVDDLVPTITAPADVMVSTVNCASVPASSVTLGTPVTADNCGVKTVTNNAPAVYPAGTTNVTWTVTDKYGNTATATQHVSVGGAEINITGNGVTIANNNTTASLADNTDFSDAVIGTPNAKTFTIQNTGSQALHISGVSSGNSALFAVSGISLPVDVPANGSTTFVVTFNAAGVGMNATTITVANDDCDESNYNFVVKADITCAAPVFTVCTAAISTGVSTGICGANVTYAPTIGGAPTPTVTYSFSGATTASGTGTGSGHVFNLGVTNVVITATNACGTATCSFTVSVNDTENPTITAPASVTVNTDNNSNKATNVNLGTPVTADNCTVIGVSNNAPVSFPIGTTVVTWTVLDGAENSATATQNVTVVDNQPPTARAKNITVYLDANGAVTITPAQVNDGSFDNDGIASYSLSKTTFNCNNVGANTVTLTVTDNNGAPATATAIVTVADNLPPVVLVNNITVQLNATGTASITLAQINNNSTDNCGIGSLSLDKGFFNCENIGANSVTLTVRDIYGNEASAIATVTVVDAIAPSVHTQNITVQLNAAGTASVTAAQINNGSIDNCSVASMSLDKTTFDCSNVGANTVILTVTDVNGNAATATAVVTVEDHINPTITAPATVNATVNNGGCVATNVNLGTPHTGDNCSVATVTNNAPANFPAGSTVVSWTVTDASGNTATATQTVNVNAPEINITGNNVSVVIGGTPSASNNTDFGSTAPGTPIVKVFLIQNTGSSPLNISAVNSTNAEYAVSGITLPVAIPVGGSAAFVVTFSSNTFGAHDQTITVVNDDCDEASYYFPVKAVVACTAPVFINTTNVTANTTSGCVATVTYALAATGVPAPSLSYNRTGATTGGGTGTGSGTTFNKGVTHVTVSATNACGNVLYSFDVTVTDNLAPVPNVASLPTVTGECSAAIGAAPTATDNCAGLVTGTTTDRLTYTEQGTYTITWTFSDGVNTSTQMQTVVVKDVTAPVINCIASITIPTDGQCGAYYYYAKPTATDNCSGSAFNFFNGGEPNNSGGEDYLQFYSSGTWNDLYDAGLMFIIEFNAVNPNAIPNYTRIGVFGGHTYYRSNFGAQWNNARNNALALGADLASINTYDENMFLAPYGGDVWVGGYQDHNDPGYAEPGVESQNFGGWKWVDGTKLGTGQITITQTAGLPSGSVFPIGTTVNTWTATDQAGNTSTCSFSVTVEDKDGPRVDMHDIYVDAAQNACSAVVTYDVSNLVTDCTPGAITVSYSVPSGSEFPIGNNPVEVTATDALGNVSYTTFYIVVNDVTAPAFTTPANMTVNNDAGQCGAIINYDVKATDCSGAHVTYSVQPGSFFGLGTTIVTITARDDYNNVSTGSFTVTVLDNEPPIITEMPANVTTTAGQDSCGKVIYFTAPTATENCAVQSQVFTYSGAPATFTVPAGVTSINVDVAGAAGGQASIYYGQYLGGNTPPKGGRVQATLSVTPGQILYLNIGGEGSIGTGGGYNGGGTGTSDGYWTGGGGGGASDIRTSNDLTSRIIVAGGGGGAGYWYAQNGGNGGDINGQDAYGYSSIAFGGTQNYGGTGGDYYSYQFAGNGMFGTGGSGADGTGGGGGGGGYYGGGGGAYGNGGGGSSYTALEIANNVIHTQGYRDGNGNITISWSSSVATAQTAGLPSGSVFPVGSTVNTFTATDAAGNVATASFTVIVTDDQKPVITAPTTISVNNDATKCGAGISIAAPASTDNCGVASTVGVRSDALALSAAYPVGTTTITWTVTDIHNNIQTATQTIVVTDNEKPVITTPTNISVNNDAANCGASVTIAAPASTDNCGVAATVGVRSDALALSAAYPVGTTTITWTVTDIHGNTQTATQTIVVTDTEKPVITAPTNISVNNDAANCGASVTITAPASTDNCGVASTVGVRSDALALTAAYPVGTTTITWTVTDIHGNTQTATQTIVVTDNQKPTIVAASNQSQTADAGDCGANVTVAAPATNDNCSVQSVTNSYNGTANASGHYPVGTTTITWTVTDIHGNTQTTTQTVTVSDNEKPTITVSNKTQTADANDCGANITVAAPATHDNCAVQSVTNSFNGTSNASGHYPVGTTNVVWTVTDIHGNTQTTTQTITVTDDQKPVIINLPANKTVNAITLNCATLVTWAKPTASDDCGIASIVSSDDFFEVAGYTLLPVGVNVITYTVTDIHGNVTTASFNITVVDNQAPIITGCPANITVNAEAGRCDKVVNWMPPTASDNCPGVSLSTNHIQGETFPLGTTTVTYTATDHTGLVTTCSFNITVVDTQKPILAGVPANVTVECNAVPNAATVTATDNCATTVAVVYNEARTNGNCASNYILTRTWTATDAAGNIASGTQVITVQDTQAPVLSAAPANVTVECNAVPAAATLTATDNCDAPHVTYNESRTNGNCPSNYILTRTWTATDACGNTSSKTQTITVQDTQAPVLSAAPANVTVECDAVPTAATLTATDNCDAPVVTYNETRTNGNSPSNYTLTRTWTATDACGNTSSKTQVITVRDTQVPVLSAAPANVTVECDAVPAAATLTATDNCDAAPVVTYNESRTNGNCPSNYILTRTWTATDASGNTSGKTQVITVQDTKAPVLSAAPANVTVECDAVPAAATLTATDNCDAPVVTYAEVRTNGNCPSNYTLTRTWTATDACGNTSSKTQVITVQDTQAPVLSAAPVNVTVECDAVPVAATLTATDNCNTPVVTYAQVRTNGNSPSNYTLTRTWTATDACGNASSKTQVITVQDTQAPVISAAPANVTVECNEVPAAAILTATDNCNTPVVVYSEVRTNGNCPSNYILTRTWTATDASGNTSSKTQVITVQDTQAPVLSAAPADVTVECDAVPAAAILTATDNCNTPSVTYNETRTNGNSPSNYTLTRTWTAVDACGNTSSKTQVITVRDTKKPVLSAAPVNVTVECNAVPAAATLTATDNCDATPVVTYNESRTNGNCPSNYTLTRTWTATDASGNTCYKTQVITVQDTQAPVLSAAPVNVTVECDAVPTAATLSATDNCDTPTVTYNEARTNGNSPSNYTLTRTWTATDACGNASSKTQVITVRDTKKPVLSTAPVNVTVECNAVPAAATLTATDNCDATPVVTYNESRTNGNCPSNYTLTRTWTATDASGNACSKTQTITVQDTQKPILSAAPANVTVACNAVPAAATLTATDNCDAPTVTYAEVRTDGSSPFNYALTRTWTATDACGNSCSKTQVITVRDTQAPVPVIALLPTLTGDCSVTATAPTAQDNCAGIITATTVNPVSYTAQGVYTITWSYNDNNGNTSTQTQRVVVKDQSGPIANVATLPTVTGQCSAIVTTKPTATDACSGVTAPATTTDPLTYNTQGAYTIHWTYTDNLGNKTYQDQSVIVKDNMAPVPNVASLPTIEGQCSVNITMVTSTRCTDNCHCCRNVCHCRTSDCHCNQWGEWLSNILSYFFGNTGDGNNDCDHDDEAEDVNNLKMQAPTATDNCKGTIIGTTTDPLNYSMQGTYTIHWTFTDGNGNTSVQNQTVTVADVEAPVPNANNLPTVYGTCSATVTGKPTAKDNCKGTLTGTTTDPLAYTGNGTYVIHWTFSDGNGNTSTQNQTVVINDNIKPALSEPNDITISCSASTLPSTTGNATATDNCGTPVITYNDVISGNRITRTWKATDAAGNYTTDVQVITISDNTKPVITAPSDLTVNCGTSTLPAATGTAAATDNCSTATVTYSDHTSGNVITRTWKATDAAGNNSTDVQTITIVDLVKPTITAPNNVNVNCGSSTNPSATGTATGADNCSGVSINYTDATSGNVITRTWKATDASGNFITATQTVTVVDNTKPVISDASDITISCSASTLPASCGGIPNASDNCSAVVVTYSDVTAGNKITRTWKATDAAGNFATSIQVITIVDNTKPVLTEPNDITINCGASTLPAVTGNATATDNCSTPTVTYTDATSGNVITRTWKATDASGNYVTDVQYITMGSAFTAGLTSVPTNSTYTGGVNTNLYLGFGAQSTTLQMCNLPSAGAPYTYAWSGSASNKLNSTTTASPVFTPTMFGYYTFAVTVTNRYGCTSFANISICVTDIRVPGTNGAKVYVCHTPNGKNAVAQTLQVAISQVSSHIGSGSCGSNGNDRLGSCDQSPCNTPVTNSIVGNTSKATGESSEEVVTTDEDLKVTVMPNPTTTFFTLKLESKYETPLNMRVMDARGRVIDAKSKIGANSTIQIGHNYSSGTYYAEIIQGTKRKVVQMIKGRG
jgi:hypothetical protein